MSASSSVMGVNSVSLAADDLVLGQLVHQTVEIQLSLSGWASRGRSRRCARWREPSCPARGSCTCAADGQPWRQPRRWRRTCPLRFPPRAMMWPLTRTVTSQIAGSGLAGFFSVLRTIPWRRCHVHSLDRVTDLLLSVLTKGVGDGHFASGHGDRHDFHLFTSLLCTISVEGATLGHLGAPAKRTLQTGKNSIAHFSKIDRAI